MRRARLVLGGLGLVLLVRGVLGTITDPDIHLVSQAAFLATVLIGHDAVMMPVAIAVGAALARWVPGSVRGPVRAGMFASLMLVVVAFPFVVGAGASADNPSVLPLDYARGLLIALATVWAVAGVVLGGRLTARRHAAARARRARDRRGPDGHHD